MSHLWTPRWPRSPLYTTAPLLAAACYAVAIVVLWREVGALTRKERGA